MTLQERLREYQSYGSSLEATQLCNESADRIDTLEAENARLAQDVARYRWLRETTNTFTNNAGERINVKLHPEEWNAFIDKAMKEQT